MPHDTPGSLYFCMIVTAGSQGNLVESYHPLYRQPQSAKAPELGAITTNIKVFVVQLLLHQKAHDIAVPCYHFMIVPQLFC